MSEEYVMRPTNRETSMRPCLRAACFGLLLAATGCALTSKSDPQEPRFYSPERAAKATGGASEGATAAWQE